MGCSIVGKTCNFNLRYIYNLILIRENFSLVQF